MQRLRERVPSVPVAHSQGNANTTGTTGTTHIGSSLNSSSSKALSPRSSHNSHRPHHPDHNHGNSTTSEDVPLLPSLTGCDKSDKDGYDMTTTQPWRRTGISGSHAIPSAPPSSNLPLHTTRATSVSSDISITGAVTLAVGVVATVAVSLYAGMMRDVRVRWYMISPTMRRICLWGILPLLVLGTLTEVIDTFCLRNGPPQWKDVTSSFQIHSHDFAVVINTYQRPKQLANAVRHYADTCGTASGVQHVYIVWAEEGLTPPTPESFFAHSMRSSFSSSSGSRHQYRAPVSIVTVRNSLNSRFLPIAGVTNMAVFMVDDDIRVSCASLRAGFAAWKTHPFSMVGYYPRLAVEPQRGQDTLTAGDGSPTQFVYQSWPVVFWRSRLNFILTKACFLHSRYMSLYSDPNSHPTDILNYVDTYFNCEDVAMSLLVANVTKGEPSSRPIYVEGSVSDKGLFNGISTGTGHMTRRSDCLINLTSIYQRNGWDVPLDTVFSMRESSWVLHAPGFWWQSRPSNLFEWFALENAFK